MRRVCLVLAGVGGPCSSAASALSARQMCYATHPRLALEQTAGGARRPHLWVLHAGREQYVAVSRCTRRRCAGWRSRSPPSLPSPPSTPLPPRVPAGSLSLWRRPSGGAAGPAGAARSAGLGEGNRGCAGPAEIDKNRQESINRRAAQRCLTDIADY